MKIFAWLQMSILVALIISWPLVLAGVSKGEAGLASLCIGALLMLARRPQR